MLSFRLDCNASTEEKRAVDFFEPKTSVADGFSPGVVTESQVEGEQPL